MASPIRWEFVLLISLSSLWHMIIQLREILEEIGCWSTSGLVGKGKVCTEAYWPTQLELNLVSMKQQLEVSPLPSGWDASPLQGYPLPQHFIRLLDNSPVPICNPGGGGGRERGTVRIKCFAQECNTLTWPGLKPTPLSPESSALTNRLQRLSLIYHWGTI